MLTLGLTAASAQEPNPNFYIYLCFGQSNMEGNAQWETCDEGVNSRFRMFATTNFSSPTRVLGNEYIANCPIVSPVGKLGMSDYFGRTMVAALPKDVKVGVVAVAMGGSPIEMFDKDKCEQKLADNPNEYSPGNNTEATPTSDSSTSARKHSRKASSKACSYIRDARTTATPTGRKT